MSIDKTLDVAGNALAHVAEPVEEHPTAGQFGPHALVAATDVSASVPALAGRQAAAAEPAAEPAAANLQADTLFARAVVLDGADNNMVLTNNKTRAYTIGMSGDQSSIAIANDQRAYTIILDGAKGNLWASNNVNSKSFSANIVDLDGPNNHIKFAHSKTRTYTIGINGDQSQMAFANSNSRAYTVIIDGQHGDISLTNADCAEEFDIDEQELKTVAPGTVMVIGENGVLRPSTEPYDSRVAGVLSGAGNYQPAMVLDRQPDSVNRRPLALIGKVFCLVDASSAPIRAGNLLTTSATVGHAMKVTDPVQAIGAVLGKALRSLDKGRGLIPILVTAR